MVKIKERKMKVESKIEEPLIKQEFRPYMGASGLGSKCHREIWYNFRCVKERVITPRLNRLFSRGHREEPIIHADLKAVGVVISGLQEEGIFAAGHGKGHCDGILSNVPGYKKIKLLNEIKTANEKRFADIKRNGVRISNIGYYEQVQVYMKLFSLQKCLFIVVNKNTDERYYEVIDFKPVHADEIICRANNLIFSTIAPKRVSEDPNFYLCRWCNYSDICYNTSRPLKHCRTCNNGNPVAKGKWNCKRNGKELSFKKQLKGCKKHDWLF